MRNVDIPLLLKTDGPGSEDGIRKYIQEVLQRRTQIESDTSSFRLADAITQSVLHRLGYSRYTGEATYQVTVDGAPDDSPEDHDHIDQAEACLEAMAGAGTYDDGMAQALGAIAHCMLWTAQQQREIRRQQQAWEDHQRKTPPPPAAPFPRF